MCHSSSIKDLHVFPTKNDDEHVQELLSSILDTVDRESHSPTDGSRVLFNAAAHARRRTSSDRQLADSGDHFYSLDGQKHSSGILIDESDVPPRKRAANVPLSSTTLMLLAGYPLENCVPVAGVTNRFGEIDSKRRSAYMQNLSGSFRTVAKTT